MCSSASRLKGNWHAGDKSCKVWDSSMLTCLHSLAADCGGVTSCHIASTGSAGSSAGQQTVLVSSMQTFAAGTALVHH